jgi:addiction module HigA family antidote
MDLSSLLSQLSEAHWDLSVVTGSESSVITYRATVPRIDVSRLLTSGTPVETTGTVEPQVRIPSNMVEVPHPGAFFSDLNLKGNFGITKKNLQDSLYLTPGYVDAFLNSEKPMTPEMALRLEKHFKQLGRSADFWVQMQAQHDLQQMRKKKEFQ